MYQRNRRHHAEHQQHGREFKRQQVSGINLCAQIAHVAVIGGNVFHCAKGGEIGVGRDKNHNQQSRHQHANHQRGGCVSPKALAHGFNVNVEHHHHKQEHHHHRTDIHHHQRDAEKFGLHQQPCYRAHAKREHQPQRGVHGVFGGYGFQCAKQDDGGQSVEQD